MNRETLSRRFLLIYQMPKTGSQTVEASLQQCRLPHQVFRFHFLSQQIANSMRSALRFGQATEEWKTLARDQLVLMMEISRIIRLRKRLRFFRLKVPKLEIITGLREPIALALSSIFENQELLFRKHGSGTPEKCRAELMRPNALKNIQNWFDLEVKPTLGIDVYSKPFPQAKGYAIYENYFARLLVYRYEALAALPGMLSEFLNCEVPAVINRNIGSAKPYGAAYEEIKTRLRMPLDFLTEQYNSKMMRHFYSDAERQQFIQRWAEEPISDKAAIAA